LSEDGAGNGQADQCYRDGGHPDTAQQHSANRKHHLPIGMALAIPARKQTEVE
jgi:hypothetical protein